VPRAGFDDIAALGQASQLGFELRPCDPVTRLLAQQLLERRPAVRQLADVLDQGLRHDPLYW
jgi:hypothetical protein